MSANRGLVLPAYLALVLLAAQPSPAAAPPNSPVRLDRYGDPLPPGAVARLGTTRLWHGDFIHSVPFSPDGKTIASVAGAGVVFWDRATGARLRELSEAPDALKSIDFSPDGKTLVGGGAFTDRYYFWDVTSGQFLRSAGRTPAPFEKRRMSHEPADEVRALALSPNGKLLATAETSEPTLEGGHVAQATLGSRSLRPLARSHTFLPGIGGQLKHVLCLRDMATGRELLHIPGKSGERRFVCVAFSPDSKSLAAGVMGGPVRLHDAATGKVGRQLNGTNTPLCLAFSPDGKTLAIGYENGQVRLWDVSAVRRLRLLWDQRDAVRSVLFTPDGKGLFTGSSDRVSLRDVASGKEKWRSLAPDSTGSLALSPDGKCLAGGGGDTVRLWEAATGSPALQLDGHCKSVSGLAFRPDGCGLVSCGSDAVLLWGLRNGKAVRRFSERGIGADAFALAPDGRCVAAADLQEGLRLWDAHCGKALSRFGKLKDGAQHIVFTPDGRSVVSRHKSGLIRVWGRATGKAIRQFGSKRGEYESGPGFCVLSPDGALVAVGGNNEKTRLWRVADGKLVRELGEEAKSAFFVAFSPDGKLLATGGYEDVQVWDVSTGKELQRLRPKEGWVAALAFSPDGRALAAAGNHEVIRIWEMATGDERRRLSGHRGGYQWARALAFSPDGRLLASDGEGPTILLWEVFAPAVANGPAQLAAAWEALAGQDAARAYDGICRLVAAPVEAVPLLRDRLRPVPRLEPGKVERLIAELGADAFEVRERATRELRRSEEQSEEALEEAGRSGPLEIRLRANRLLAQLRPPFPPERLRALRAVEALEHMGGPEATMLLRALAEGAPAARLTREARDALARLAKRPPGAR